MAFVFSHTKYCDMHFVYGLCDCRETYMFFLRNELPGLLKDIPLMVRGQIYFQHDGAPQHYTWHVREYLLKSLPNG